MTILKEKNINKNVIDALNLSDKTRIELFKKLTPRYLHRTAPSFTGTVGSETYKMINDGRYVYFTYIFQNK